MINLPACGGVGDEQNMYIECFNLPAVLTLNRRKFRANIDLLMVDLFFVFFFLSFKAKAMAAELGKATSMRV